MGKLCHLMSQSPIPRMRGLRSAAELSNPAAELPCWIASLVIRTAAGCFSSWQGFTAVAGDNDVVSYAPMN